MTMKKSTIWILGVVMGLSFLSLLYLQISYIEEMVKMRNGQFDESVKRALMAASKEAESAEVVRWLNEDISEAEKKAWEQSQSSSGVMPAVCDDSSGWQCPFFGGIENFQ